MGAKKWASTMVSQISHMADSNKNRADNAASGTNLDISSAGNFVGNSPYKRQSNTASQNADALKKKKSGTNSISSKGLNIT